MRPWGTFARTAALAALGLAAAFAAGCSVPGFGEGKRGRYPGEIDRVKPGMTLDKVFELIGHPVKEIQGRDLDIQNSTLVYPKGAIYVRRMVATKVVPDDYGRAPPESSIDRAVQRYTTEGVPFHQDDEAWYKQDETERDRKEVERKERKALVRPSTAR